MGNIQDEWAKEYWGKKLDNWIKEPKYKNKKIIFDGKKFDSHKECDRYLELKMLEKQGIIKNLKLQEKFELQPSYKKNGKTIRAINYIADFTYSQHRQNDSRRHKGLSYRDIQVKEKNI